MSNFQTTFTLDLLHTIGLFVLCFFAVVIAKAIIFLIKTLMPAKTHATIQPQQTKTIKKPRVKKPTPVRSIEIDPLEIDRIYVRKS